MKIPHDQLFANMEEILDRVVSGEELLVTRNGVPIARITPEPPETPAPSEATKPAKRPDRVLGSAKDIILWVSPDFDEPLEDMREYME